jgi:hypothetical protein
MSMGTRQGSGLLTAGVTNLEGVGVKEGGPHAGGHLG